MPDTVAFIDVGTNSIHMLVVRFYGSIGDPIYQEKESVRLGESLYRYGYLDKPTLEKVDIVLSNFSSIANQYGAEKILAVGTCAARETPNRADLVSIAEKHGLTLNIISGHEEARLTRLGAAGTFCKNRTLCIDIGGGSTELALSFKDEDLYLDSLNLGAIRMALVTKIDSSGIVPPKQYNALKKEISEQCQNAIVSIKKLGFDTVIGSSGTMETLAEACAARRGDNDATYLTRIELQSLMKTLCNLTARERGKVPKIGANRADIIVGGGAIADTLMELLNIERLCISKNSLREGMMTDYSRNNCSSDLSVRESSVVSLAARCNCTTRHETAVKRHCTMMCDELERIGVLHESKIMKPLLMFAAQLHDIGTVISYEKHHILSHMIIRNSNLIGFDEYELERIALIARFHHGALPRVTNKLFNGMTRKEIDALLKYALILKISDKLDRERNDAVEGIDAEILNDTLNLTITAKSDISLSIWKLKSLSNEFANVFGYRLEVRSRSAE